ncbi:two-component sensor histidine kinase [Streptomyces sp. TM32]|uniref:sensor histidine kinase n=1 Tax=Streptomyces sp. TM32 TaxID=1652669 RepID=UPI001013A379|nr:histidine kinase [Streptomyces sp. TM32]RXS88418.1 two-component sensor histidine kinase [Streptomyces sp. TM32]
MSSSAPPVSEHHTPRSLFAEPGERGRQLWRAAGEALLAAVLVLLTYWAESGIDARLGLGWPAVPLEAVGVALVLVRRRYPVAAVVGLAALMGVVPSVALLTAVAAHTATRQLRTPRRRFGVLLGAAAVAMLTCAVCAPVLELGSHLFGLALAAVLAVATVVVPGLVGTTAGQSDRLLRALRERAAAAEEARRLTDSESRMRERSRIAAEMHDLVGHRLSLVSLHAGGLEMALLKEAPELRDEAAVVRRATRDAMQELREVLGVLGPLGGDTGIGALTDATGTRADVEALVEESRGGGIPAELVWEGPDLDARPARVRRAVHRVVRESLTNVHRYAAGAHVTVTVRHTGERVEVRVRNGAPPTRPPLTTGLGSGRGLTGMRERVALLGGDLEAGPTPGGGFAVAADLPADPGPGAETVEAAPDDSGPVAVDEPGSGLSVLQRRIAGAVTGLLGLVGVSAMMLFGVLLVDHSRYDLAYRSPQPPRVGMTREQVQRTVAPDDPASRAAAAGREPPRPGSATDCLYPYAGEKPEHGRLELVRYCFRSDTLIAIDRFTVPLVTEPHGGRRTHD